MKIEIHKILLKFGFSIAGIYWGLIFALILDSGIISAMVFLGCSLIGYILGIVSNVIINFCHHRDLINKD